jgi:hypothetical protein
METSATTREGGEGAKPKAYPKLLKELQAILDEMSKTCKPGDHLYEETLDHIIIRVLGPCSRSRIKDRIMWLRAFGVIEPSHLFPYVRSYVIKRLSV